MAKLYDGREAYTLNEAGEITRKCLNNQFSGNWRLLGMARFNNFGSIVERVPFPECLQITEWHYKNGRPKWYPMDLDHGTRRIWGRGAKIIK